MTLTAHAKQRIEQRAKIRNITPNLGKLERNFKCDVAVILGKAKSLAGDIEVFFVAVCRDGEVKTVLWEANPTPQKLRVQFVVN